MAQEQHWKLRAETTALKLWKFLVRRTQIVVGLTDLQMKMFIVKQLHRFDEAG